MLTKRAANCFGVVSLVLSLSFWVGFLPQSVPGVRLINWGVGTHIIPLGSCILARLSARRKGLATVDRGIACAGPKFYLLHYDHRVGESGWLPEPRLRLLSTIMRGDA